MSNNFELNLKVGGDSLGQVLQELAQLLPRAENLAAKTNLKVVQEHIEGIKMRSLNRINATLANSFTLTSDTLPTYGFPSRRTDREGYARLWRQLWSSFPDSNYQIEEGPVAIGDLVIYTWRGGGGQRGMWAGVADTGKQLDVNGCSVFRVKNGKIAEDYEFFDTGKLLQMMGAVQVPGSFYSQEGQSTSTRPQLASEALNKMRQLEEVLVQFTQSAESQSSQSTQSPNP